MIVLIQTFYRLIFTYSIISPRDNQQKHVSKCYNILMELKDSLKNKNAPQDSYVNPFTCSQNLQPS